ncbi:hypothetical protein EBR96_00580, partial [bacterium]|nr:hypothetical protein [bacterium]
TLRITLRNFGARVTQIPIYKPEKKQINLPELTNRDFVVFTSGNIAIEFFRQYPSANCEFTAVAIGPKTSEILLDFDYPHIVAHEATLTGVLNLILSHLQGAPPL